jgi:hypothetical protein
MPDWPFLRGNIGSDGGKTLASGHYQSLEHGEIKTAEKFW